MNTWGQALRLSIFGESHGSAIGITIDGLPAGLKVDMAGVRREMLRRAPGQNSLSTARQESDEVEIVSGFSGLGATAAPAPAASTAAAPAAPSAPTPVLATTGTPICGIIHNRDVDSSHYDSRLRPGHADWTALLKYGGYADMRGGGHFSGRLTAALVFAGSLAKQALSIAGLEVYGRIAQIGKVCDELPDKGLPTWQKLAEQPFPAIGADAMQNEIRQAQQAGDSVGGMVEVMAFGVPGGLGDPFFGSMESNISSLLYAVPAVKAVQFGDGVDLAAMQGSQANDELDIKDGVISALSNHNGGILGGITNGMPLVVKASIKPTPSIAIEQRTVDSANMQPATIKVEGRHDPCIVPRAVPVVEAAVALAILDRLLASPRHAAVFSSLWGEDHGCL
ncbi:MAG: chorismate synthase [Coriobacteriia bacterium]|nr:chorismate synthase [Coriobacteriia bacterium]